MERKEWKYGKLPGFFHRASASLAILLNEVDFCFLFCQAKAGRCIEACNMEMPKFYCQPDQLTELTNNNFTVIFFRVQAINEQCWLIGADILCLRVLIFHNYCFVCMYVSAHVL